MASGDESTERESVSELAEEVGRDAAVLALRRAQLELSEQAPEVRRTARAIGVAGICLVALLTAFVFGNWAAASALSSPLPGWRAPLVLAAAWVVVGVVVATLWLRSERAAVLRLRVGGETLAQRREAVEDAEQALRQTLDQLSDAIAEAAQERIAAAILPVAGGMVDVGEDMVEATDDVIEAADEITDAVEEAVPGGVVVNRAVDFALAPGRFGVRVARTVFSLGRNTPGDAS
jgi:cell fate (sporulation/competence/biofilm development) regulator YlbF (YheA/YmcA/DUF963 family)